MATIVLGSQFGDEGIHSMVSVTHLSYCCVSVANVHLGKGKLVDILCASSVRLLQPIISLFKQIGSTETLSRCFRAPQKG